MTDIDQTERVLSVAPASGQHVHIGSDTLTQLTELAHASTAIQIHGDTVHLLAPTGFKHIDLTELVAKTLPLRSRKAGMATLGDLDSFLTYAADQAMHNQGYIYADLEGRKFTVVFNDYRDAEAAGWRDFRAVYQAQFSREFAIWLGRAGKSMEQEEFAIFLEDNIADVVEPSGEVLLQIATTLQAKTEINFNSSRRLDNGQVQLTYAEVIDARAGVQGSIEIPREFAIGVRLFQNGDGFKLKARFKYRLIGGGKIKFWYELDRVENAIEQAFLEYVAKVKAESNYTVLIGTP
jgi:uncharacterized protein YfdQ (DUF2303 family)